MKKDYGVLSSNNHTHWTFTSEIYKGILASPSMAKINIKLHTICNYPDIRHVFIPIPKKYKNRKGLSEKILKKRLEKQGWTVWRGGLINIIRNSEIYPSVRKKYALLCILLKKHDKNLEYLQYICEVHHGMPDFICYRNNKFKFVECKLGYESLSKRQKKCIKKLQDLGFKVEVHKLVEKQTKTRLANINLNTGQKKIIAKQSMIRNFQKPLPSCN